MSNKLIIPKALVYDYLGTCEVLSIEPWRHGTAQTILFYRDNKHWIVTIQVHPEDGWQIYGDLEAKEAELVTRTVSEWLVKE